MSNAYRAAQAEERAEVRRLVGTLDGVSPLPLDLVINREEVPVPPTHYYLTVVAGRREVFRVHHTLGHARSSITNTYGASAGLIYKWDTDCWRFEENYLG